MQRCTLTTLRHCFTYKEENFNMKAISNCFIHLTGQSASVPVYNENWQLFSSFHSDGALCPRCGVGERKAAKVGRGSWGGVQRSQSLLDEAGTYMVQWFVFIMVLPCGLFLDTPAALYIPSSLTDQFTIGLLCRAIDPTLSTHSFRRNCQTVHTEKTRQTGQAE